MLHKIALGKINNYQVNFYADNLLEYFLIENIYRLPYIPQEYSSMQNLRGMMVTHIEWWKHVGKEHSNLYERSHKISIENVACSLLFKYQENYLGFPVDEISFIKEVPSENISTNLEQKKQGIPESYDGNILINPLDIASQIFNIQGES